MPSSTKIMQDYHLLFHPLVKEDAVYGDTSPMKDVVYA